MPVPQLAYILVSGDAPATLQPQPEGGTAAPAVAAAAATPAATDACASLAAPPQPPARYTPSLLRGTLQLMGAKPRHSERVARKAFLILQQRAALPPAEPLSLAARLVAAPGGRAGVSLARPEFDRLLLDCLNAAETQPATAAAAAEQLAAHEAGSDVVAERQLQRDEQQAQQAGSAAQQDVQRAQDVQQRQQGEQAPLQQQQHPQQDVQQQHPHHPQPVFTLEDLHVACSLREQRSSVAVLLCGTSGTGKSTLAALLAARLGISTVVSTDSIRHMMRSFSSEAEDPLLWASTYQAGPHLQQLAAAQAAQAATQAAAAGSAAGSSADTQAAAAPSSQQPRLLPRPQQQQQQPRASLPLHPSTQRYALLPAGGMDARKAAVRGYKAQAARVLEHVDRLLTGCEARRQSVVVEGVHLSLSMVVRMMQRHPSVVPFLVHISNEAKHMERFAVRSKVMTLRPDGNRYVKHFRNIRAIQDYLGKSADKHAIPKVDNTNVDRSVATIHATLLGCLRRTARGETVLAPGPSLTCKLLLEEYLRCQSATWSGRDMLELIRRKSAAGEAPSPSDLESTAATAAAAASTPRGPLSEAAAEELHANGAPGRSATPTSLHNSSGEALDVRAGQAAGRQQQQQGRKQQEQEQQRVEEDEGDNRSFYGSDSQSSSGDGTSHSCSGSSHSSSPASSDGEKEHGAVVGCRSGSRGAAGNPPFAANGARTDHDRQQAQQVQRQQRRQRPPADGEAGEGGNLSDAGPGPLRRQRQRGRRHRWRLGSGRGSGAGVDEIPAGPIPEQLRRRSDVGSVLEPDAQSELDELEVTAGG